MDADNREEEHTANTALCTLCSRAQALISEIYRLKASQLAPSLLVVAGAPARPNAHSHTHAGPSAERLLSRAKSQVRGRAFRLQVPEGVHCFTRDVQQTRHMTACTPSYLPQNPEAFDERVDANGELLDLWVRRSEQCRQQAAGPSPAAASHVTRCRAVHALCTSHAYTGYFLRSEHSCVSNAGHRPPFPDAGRASRELPSAPRALFPGATGTLGAAAWSPAPA